MSLTVACVLWMGKFEDRKYTPAWVYRLRDMVKEHLSLPHRFVCLSNTDIPGIEVIPLKKDWPGWWAKVELFDPAHDLGERVLYLDLDVYVTGDLAPIATYPAPMALMPPNYEILGIKPKDKPGVYRRYQASCMVWTPPAGRDLHRLVTPSAMKKYRTDQDLIGDILPGLAKMPVEWFAKLKQCENGKVPDGVKIVLAHQIDLIGRPL